MKASSIILFVVVLCASTVNDVKSQNVIQNTFNNVASVYNSTLDGLDGVYNSLTRAINRLRASTGNQLFHVLEEINYKDIFDTSDAIQNLPDIVGIIRPLNNFLMRIPLINNILGNAGLANTLRGIVLTVFEMIRTIVNLARTFLRSFTFLMHCPSKIISSSASLVVKVLDFLECLLFDASFTDLITLRFLSLLPVPVIPDIQRFVYSLVNGLLNRVRYPIGFILRIVSTILDVIAFFLNLIISVMRVLNAVLRYIPGIAQLGVLITVLLSYAVSIVQHRIVRHGIAGLIGLPFAIVGL